MFKPFPRMFRNLRPIPEWRQAPKMFSVQSMGATKIIIASWVMLPHKMQDAIPPTFVMSLAFLVLALGMVGRLTDQGIKRGKTDTDDPGVSEPVSESEE